MSLVRPGRDSTHANSSSLATPRGDPSTRAHFKAILRRASLPESTRIHDLRHAAATALANSNAVPLTVARDELGQSSVRMTQR